MELYQTSRNYRLAIGIMFNVGDKADHFLQNIIDGYEKNPLSA